MHRMATSVAPKIERRFTPLGSHSITVEERDGSPPKIQGYGAVFYDGTPATEYNLWEGAKERIMPTAFDRAIAEAHDARGLFNHDPNMLLGRVSAGTMKVEKFSRGARYTINALDTQAGRDVILNIRAKNLTGSSFAFEVTKHAWSKEQTAGDSVDIRAIEDVTLFDMGPVTYPAYEGTTTGLRAAGDSTEARANHSASQNMILSIDVQLHRRAVRDYWHRVEKMLLTYDPIRRRCLEVELDVLKTKLNQSAEVVTRQVQRWRLPGCGELRTLTIG